MENTDSNASNKKSNSCENTCSKHNQLRTINYSSYGMSYIAGTYFECVCKCDYCSAREKAFNDSMDAYTADYNKNG